MLAPIPITVKSTSALIRIVTIVLKRTRITAICMLVDPVVVYCSQYKSNSSQRMDLLCLVKSFSVLIKGAIVLHTKAQVIVSIIIIIYNNDNMIIAVVLSRVHFSHSILFVLTINPLFPVLVHLYYNLLNPLDLALAPLLLTLSCQQNEVVFTGRE